MMQTTLGIRNFAWYDDALLYEAEKHFLPLTQTIMEYGIDARFHLPNGFHARWVTPSVAASMKSTGFTTLRLGYESGVSTNASHTSGKSNPDDVARAISILRHAGFKRTEIGIYVMGGIPGQTPDEMIGELIFVGRLGVMPKPVFLSPVPGTPLFEHYAQVFPQIRSNPLLHNDTSFVTCLPGWNYEAVERIMGLARTVSRGESL